MRGKCVTSSMREDAGMNPAGVIDRVWLMMGI